MKRLFVLLFITFIFSVEAAAQNYGLDDSDPSLFSKYRIPDTKLSALWAWTNLRLTTNKNANTSSFYSESSSYNSEFYYNLSPQYYFRDESDIRTLSIYSTIIGTYTHRYQEQNGDYYRKSSNNTLNLHFTGTYNNYFNPNELFYSLSSDLSVNFNNTREDYPANNVKDTYTGLKDQNYYIAFGIGWGNIRNVTPVVSALRLQERLKQLSLINNNLSNTVVEALAETFSRSSYYSGVHVRPEKFFWDDIEKTLNENGVSLSGINQYGSSYLKETQNEVRFLRNEGLQFGINAQLNYINSYYKYIGGWGISEQFYILANPYVNYSHQLNLNSQINLSLTLSGGPNLIENQHNKQKYTLMLNAGYDYELTDRVVASINDSYGLVFYNQRGQQRNLTNQLSVGLNYFVEDNLSLTADYSWNYSENRYPGQMKLTNNNNNVTIGFTYYFNRGFLFK